MIIGLSGYKQSGKNTACNFLGGYRLMTKNCIQSFNLTSEGQILSFKEEVEEGIYDIEDDSEFNQAIAWQFARVFSYADDLKEMAVTYFGLTTEQAYGTNEEKNSFTSFAWKSMPRVYKKYKTGKGSFLTGREFLQIFGTHVMRELYADIWCMACMRRIKQHLDHLPTKGSCLCLVSDVRFPNEVHAIRNTGGKVIRLTREPLPDDSATEHALDQDVFDWNNFDAVIDNAELDIPQQNHALFDCMCEWGLYSKEDVTETTELYKQTITE